MRRQALTALLLGLACQAAAQSPTVERLDGYTVRRFSQADGLPADQITGLSAQPGGYLWASTYAGLVRFDGQAFTVFDRASAEGLTANRLVHVHAERDAVWVQTQTRELLRFAGGAFQSASAALGVGPGATLEHADADGTLWFTSRDGVWRLAGGAATRLWATAIPAEATHLTRTPAGDTWVTVPGGAVHVAASGAVARHPVPASWGPTFVDVATDGTVWIATWMGPARLDGRRFVLVPLAGDPAVFSLWSDPRGQMWGSTSSGWHALSGAGARPIERPDSLDGTTSWNAVADARGASWRVVHGALYRNETPVYRLPASASSRSTFHPLAVDAEGNVWLGGLDGLRRLSPHRVRVVSEEDGLGGRNAYPVLATRDGSVWVGLWYERHLLTRLADGVPVEHVPIPGQVAVTALHEDRAGTLWAGTGDYVWRIRGGRAARLRMPPRQYFGFVSAIFEDRRGDLWVGGTLGLARLRRAGRGWRTRYWPTDFEVRGFYETRRGDLLVASTGAGLGRRLPTGAVEWLGTRRGLSSNQVRDVYEDERGVLWIATEDRGLCRLEVGADGSLLRSRPRCLTTREGLFANSLHRILPDGEGRLWINSNDGLFAVTRDQADRVAAGREPRLHVLSITTADGLRNQEGNGGRQPAGGRTADGRLWFPTQDGLAVLTPSALRAPPPPPSRIVSLQVGPRDVPESAWGGTVPMSPRERDLRVGFTGVALTDPGALRFRVRLAGYSDAWRSVGEARSESFTNLPPGTFRFEVQAGTGGRWGPSAVLTVERRPLVWETVWFRLLAVLLGVGLVALGVRWRIRALARRQAELEHTVEVQTADLRRANAVKSQFLANISHELRTPLTLLLGPVLDLQRGRFPITDEAARLLENAATNGRRLQTLIDDLLMLSRIDADALVLRRTRQDVVAFTRARVAAFGSRPAASGLVLAFETATERLDVAVDGPRLETVLYNLIGNALKFTPPGGTVTVRVAPHGDGVEITVRDTGIGVAPADVPRLFDRFYQADTVVSRAGEGTGLGLALSREVVELHGGTLDAESTLGVGTTLTVRLPAGTPDARQPDEMPAPDVAPDVAVSLPPPVSLTLSAARAGDGLPDPDAVALREGDERPLVLVVEDNPDLRTYLRALLAPAFAVEEAPDGGQGISRALALVPDLVLSDVTMPDVDGFALLAALKADVRTSHVPVVLLTARADAESRLLAFGAGADGYVAKPFEADELLARVHNLIRGRLRLRALWDAGAVRGAAPAGAPDPGDAAAPPPPGRPPAEAAFLARVHETIEAHLGEQTFGVDALADALGLSARQLRRKLAALTDESPSDLVRRRRLARAAALLAEGTRSVKEVAAETGFSSDSGFRHAFREAHGVAPSEFSPDGGPAD